MRKFIENNQILSFIFLTYLFSWLLWSYLLFTQNITNTTEWLIIIGGFGPVFGALITNYFINGKKQIKKWFKKIIKTKPTLKSVLFGLTYPLIVSFLVYIIINSFQFNNLIREVNTNWYLYPLNLLTIMFLGGGQEEFGWRGFLLPKLLNKFNPFVSSLMIGLVWYGWHIPLYFIEGSPQANLPLGLYLLNILALSMILTFLQNKIGNSNVIPAVILHGGINISQNYFNIHAAKAYYLYTIINILIVFILIIRESNFWMNKSKKSML